MIQEATEVQGENVVYCNSSLEVNLPHAECGQVHRHSLLHTRAVVKMELQLLSEDSASFVKVEATESNVWTFGLTQCCSVTS